MASITIRKLDEETKRRLRIRAAEHGRSMEEEARDILQTSLSQRAPGSVTLAAAVRARFEPLGGVDLTTHPREPLREPPDFPS